MAGYSWVRAVGDQQERKDMGSEAAELSCEA